MNPRAKKRTGLLLLVGGAVLAILLIALLDFASRDGVPARPRPGDDPHASGPAAVQPIPDTQVADDETVEEPPAGAVLVVHCPDAPDAVAFVSVESPDGSFLAARAGLEAGAAELPVAPEWFGAADTIRLTAGVAGIGVPKTMCEVEIARGETKEVTLTPEPGLTITGRVVDEHGSGVPDLRLVARTMRRPGMKQPGAYASDDLLFSAHALIEARAVTGKDGRFRLRGLSDCAHYISTSDMEWVIVPDQPPMTPPLADLELLAERSYRLDLEVTDSLTGALIAYARARLQVDSDEGSAYFSLSCKDGRGAVVWPTRGSAMREGSEFAFNMKVTAYGYEPRTVKVRFPAGERVVSQSVELTAVPMGELVFEITSADGSEVEGSMTAKLARQGGGHVISLQRDPGSTTYRARVPAGAWDVAVYPRLALGRDVFAWSDRMTVPEGGAASARVSLPAYGSVFVDRGRFPGLLLHLRVKGRSVRLGIGKDYHRLPAVPAGVWPYTAHAAVDGVTKQIQKGSIEVRQGEETVLRIE